jgi:hypothetical protein
MRQEFKITDFQPIDGKGILEARFTNSLAFAELKLLTKALSRS